MEKIFKLKGICKDYVWGGQNLAGFSDTPIDRIAEVWSLSAHGNDLSVIAEGEYAGKTLDEVVTLNPDFMGENAKRFSYFPILIKFIDSADNLSVQVHPGDEYAQKAEGEPGKTEAWYIIEGEPGAGIYCGLKKPLTKDEFLDHAKTGGIMDYLNFYKVRKGDAFFIPAGTLHAVGKGVTLCEVQQNSNVTYRVYDYDRTVDGKPRDLHLEKAADVVELSKGGANMVPGDTEILSHSMSNRTLADCSHFKMREFIVAGEASFNVGEDSFVSISIVKGEGKISVGDQTFTMEFGNNFFIPANVGEVKIYGEVVTIITTV